MGDGRLTLVVGGASGIGSACVDALVADGWPVLVADLQPPSDTRVAASAIVDVREADAIRSAIRELAGDEPLEAVVYAPGVAHIAPFEAIEGRHWRLMLDVNLTGALHVAQAALPHMPNGGAFVFVSSIDALSPVSGLAHYCSAKAGLEALSRSLALELGPRGIRSNVIAPGPVRTPPMVGLLEDPEVEAAFVERTPLGGIAAPEKIASVVRFLLTPDADWITGARIPIDGGMSLREHPPLLPD
jgi:NAD(P)-dependent dehydrogenase (short-subunit alcohol dehydrogenase family)